jgi:hypothetical protein
MKTKQIEMSGRRYLLRRMDPMAGSFIYLRMLGALMKTITEGQQPSAQELPQNGQVKEPTDEEKTRMLIAGSMMRGLSYEDMQFANKHALRVVSRVEEAGDGDINVPLMTDDGRWSSADYADAPGLVHQLVVEALVFNLEPFFADSGTTKTLRDPAAMSQ